MKRLALVLPLLFMMFLVSPAMARTTSRNMPLTTTLCNDNPGRGCEATSSWSPVSTRGASSYVTVDNPGGSGQQAYYKFIEVLLSGGDYVEVGVIKVPGVFSGHLEYVYAAGTLSGFQDLGQVPSGDINHDSLFQTSWFTSGTGGMIIYIKGASGDTPCGSGCFYNDSNFKNYPVTTSLQFVEEDNSSFSGHEIWGGEWVLNKYFNGSSWAYDSTAATVVTANDNGTSGQNPPQMKWILVPNGSQNNGGDNNSCVYETGGDSSCVSGS